MSEYNTYLDSVHCILILICILYKYIDNKVETKIML